MDELNELFGIEADEFQKKAKSEEEIAKWCTKDDMTELQRAVYLLKKGYEVQKLAVINNLNRYCSEIGANEELLSLIINSLEDWDTKMQIECASGFLQPIKNKLLNKDNKQRLLKLAVQLITNELIEDADHTEGWFQVYDSIIGQVDFPYVQLVALKQIAELTDRKSSFQRRLLGNRLLFSLMQNCGEDAIDEDRTVLRLVMQICGDTNYKIRTEGSIFMKKYIRDNHKALLGSNRLEQTYIPEICEMCNDEEIFIRVEAIEALSYILETLDDDLIEKEYIPPLLKLLSSQHDEIVMRMSQILGQLAYKLQAKDLHEKYKDEFIEFFKSTCVHKCEECRENSAFNLPAMNMIFRKYVQGSPELQSGLKFKPLRTITGVTASTNYEDEEESKDGDEQELPFDFNILYSQFSVDQNSRIRLTTAHSLHEAFLQASQDEDISALRDALLNILQEESNEVIIALTHNMDTLISHFLNRQAIEAVQKDAASTMGVVSDKEQERVLPMLAIGKSSNEVKGLLTVPTTTCTTTTKSRKTKKQDSPTQQLKEEDIERFKYMFMPDHPQEQLYSQLLKKIIIFKANLTKKIALWRDLERFLDKLAPQLTRFHMPEIHDKLVQVLLDDIQRGNLQVRQQCCKCLVQILVNQQDSERRTQLTQQIVSQYGESNSFQMRRVYLIFCNEAVGNCLQSYFHDHFYPAYVALANDKVSVVRQEFAQSLLKVRPFLDTFSDVQAQIHDIVSQLKNDSSHEVQDAIEASEFELLKQRKTVLVRLQELEKENIKRQKKLDKREVLETEERKRRSEEDEEYRLYEQYTALGQKKVGAKTTTRTTKKDSNPTKQGSNRKININTAPNTDKTQISTTSTTSAKRKTITGNSKRNSSALPELNPGVAASQSDQKARKSNIMIPNRIKSENAVTDLYNEIPEDNYSRQLNQAQQTVSQLSQQQQQQQMQQQQTKYKRSNSLLTPNDYQSAKNVKKKLSESNMTSPAHQQQQYQSKPLKKQSTTIATRQVDTSSESDGGTPTLGTTPVTTTTQRQSSSFSSKTKALQQQSNYHHKY